MTAPITSRNVDLSNCDRELIQFPGAILSHGVMLVIQEPKLTILQASQNTAAEFGVEASELLGQGLDKLLDHERLQQLKEELERDPLQGPPIGIAPVSLNGQEWNVLAHRHDEVLFLEFEPRSSTVEKSAADLYSELRDAIAKIQNTKSCQEFLDVTVRRIRAFTGFDRVMAYKFLEDRSGWVLSESVIEGQTPYLGLHFPPTDIPAPAHRLFALSWLRHQPDISYTPVPLVPQDNPITGRPLDLSYAGLRSVSAMYTGYLKNMGTDASMVMNLMKNGKLWGLIACHHHSGPKHVPYEVRAACEFLASVVSLQLADKEGLEFSDYKLKLKNTRTALLRTMAESGEFASGLINSNPNLLDFVDCGGAAVVNDGKISLTGNTPDEDQVSSIVEWLSLNVKDEIFATDSLAAVLPEAKYFREVASGILAIHFAATKKDYLLWFRPEILKTVKWAGNPHKPVDISDNGQRLMPRTSFALWQESVQFKSRPWLELEIDAAREFRVAILELILRQAEKIGDLYKSLERSYIELDSFAYVASHDLKEPLRGIHNYSRFLLEDCAHQLRPEDIDKLRAMTRLTQRMEDLLDSLLSYSRISRTELRRQNHDLNQVVADALDSLSVLVAESGTEIRIPRPLPVASVDATAVSEIFSNLISNALKYNNKPAKWLEIGFLDQDEDPVVFFVRDNGIGIDAEHFESIFKIFRRLHGPKEFGGGTGAGLTIAHKIVQRHQGRIWVESSPGSGATFFFTLAPAPREGGRNVSQVSDIGG